MRTAFGRSQALSRVLSPIRRELMSNHPGVTFDNAKQLYRVRIGIGGKQKQVGYFDNLEDAIRARTEAEENVREERRAKQARKRLLAKIEDARLNIKRLEIELLSAENLYADLRAQARMKP